jgi:hypothetical protein
VVLAGSQIERIDSQSIPIGIKKTRENVKISREMVLQEDVLFRSPSYVMAFVVGGHANGLTEWKTVDSVTLKNQELTTE